MAPEGSDEGMGGRDKKGGTETYALLDSGGGSKLERFGNRILARPASSCIWQRRKGLNVWKQADAVYHPSSGWKFSGDEFSSWEIELDGIKLELHLQRNGQVGVFPEHMAGFSLLEQELRSLNACGSGIEVLNLFGYTGAATLFFARLGCKVRHVDISKKAVTWANTNRKLNSLSNRLVEFVVDDALKYIARELKRSRLYRIIIADPPNFSRVSKTGQWKIEDVLVEFIASCRKLLHPKGAIFHFTSHNAGIGMTGVENIISDHFKNDNQAIRGGRMLLTEDGTSRKIDCGFYVNCSYGLSQSV